jgi:preprotein translocase SecE subunit
MAAQNDDAGQAAVARTGEPNAWQRFLRFLREVQIELKKTSWPTRNELTKSVAVVLMTVVVVAAVLLVYDAVTGKVMQWLLQTQ